jgi:serine/threonine protein phosphatase 1
MNWIIGDVHGMYSPLRRLIDAVLAADASAAFIFTGDFVNRGPDSRKVIDLLLTMKNIRCARGNHDDIFDLILHGTCFSEKAAGGTPALAFQWFMDYGLDRTFHSYGLDWQWLRDTAASPTTERMAHLAAVVPQDHKNFIRGLPAVLEFDQFFVVHGYWPPTEACYPPLIAENGKIDAEHRQLLLWGRFTLEEIDAQKPWGKRGFFGHTPIHTYNIASRAAKSETKPAFTQKLEIVPLRGPQATLLDTGCAIITQGRLTAYCVEEDRFIQTTHFGELVR